MTYAVDFDGTLCYSNYPECGEPNKPLIDFLIQEQKNGAEIILWTCREGDVLETAVAWCKEQGLTFDAVNDNTRSAILSWLSNPRKVGADVYIDDRNMPLDLFVKQEEA